MTATATVLDQVAATMRVLPEEVTGRSRTAHIAAARHVYAAVLYDLGHTLEGIGRILGRHHSTIINSVRAVEADPDLTIVAYALAEQARR